MAKWSFLAAIPVCAACLQAPDGTGASDASTTDGPTATDGARGEGQWNVDTGTAPFTKGGSTALATDGNTLWLFRRDGGLLFETTDWSEGWTAQTHASSLPDSLAYDIYGGAMAHVPDPPRLITGGWKSNARDLPDLIAYDIEGDQWSFLTQEGSLLNVGLARVGTHVFGMQHAGEPSLRRIGIDGVGEEASFLDGALGADPQWLSRAAKLAYDGETTLYLVKNDWFSPQPTDQIPGDRLLRFDPASFASIDVPATFDFTPVQDLGLLPFELGDGSALVHVPANFGGTGDQGGLLLIAGISPADEDGYNPGGEPYSDAFALYDIASGQWIGQWSLPDAVGTGTSAIFYQGSVIICAATERAAVMWRLTWSRPN